MTAIASRTLYALCFIVMLGVLLCAGAFGVVVVFFR